MKKTTRRASGFVFTKLKSSDEKINVNTDKEMKRINVLSNPDTFKEVASIWASGGEEHINGKIDYLIKHKKPDPPSRNKTPSFYYQLKNLHIDFKEEDPIAKSHSGFFNFLKTRAMLTSAMKKKEKVRVNSMSNIQILSEIIQIKDKIIVKGKNKTNVGNEDVVDLPEQRHDCKTIVDSKALIQKVKFKTTTHRTRKGRQNDNFDNFPFTKEMMKEEQIEKETKQKEKKIKKIIKGTNPVVEDEDLKWNRVTQSFISPFYRKKKPSENFDTHKINTSRIYNSTGKVRGLSQTDMKIVDKCDRTFKQATQELKLNRNQLAEDNRCKDETIERMRLGKHFGLIKELRNETLDKGKASGLFLYGVGPNGHRYSNEDRLFSSVYTMGFTKKTK